MSKDWLARSTPFPNDLFLVMPTLKDSEWRLLCVIVRSTLGWVDPVTKRRKMVDWISHSQLRERTGRHSAAVSAAVSALVSKNLIRVTDVCGRPLSSANERRRHRHRLYFSINPVLLAHA